jgi:hypothetical protein
MDPFCLRMQDGLWSCAFCSMECAPSEICWDLHGSLMVRQATSGSAAAEGSAELALEGRHGTSSVGVGELEGGPVAAAEDQAAGTSIGQLGSEVGSVATQRVRPSPSIARASWTLPADPAALRMLLGVSAEAWRGMGSARRAEWKQAVSSASCRVKGEVQGDRSSGVGVQGGTV